MSARRTRRGVHRHAGWTLTARTVGDVQLRLWTDAATARLRERILSSATRVVTDRSGCDVSAPV